MLAASIIRVVSKPCVCKSFEIWEPVRQDRTLARPMRKRVREKLITEVVNNLQD
jgi:hypothetical protein